MQVGLSVAVLLEVDPAERKPCQAVQDPRTLGGVVRARAAFDARTEGRDERKGCGEEIPRPLDLGRSEPVEADLREVRARRPGSLDHLSGFLYRIGGERDDDQGPVVAHRSSIVSSIAWPRWRAAGKRTPRTFAPTSISVVGMRPVSVETRTVSAS